MTVESRGRVRQWRDDKPALHAAAATVGDDVALSLTSESAR